MKTVEQRLANIEQLMAASLRLQASLARSLAICEARLPASADHLRKMADSRAEQEALLASIEELSFALLPREPRG